MFLCIYNLKTNHFRKSKRLLGLLRIVCVGLIFTLICPGFVSAQKFQIVNSSINSIQENQNNTSKRFQVNARLSSLDVAGKSNRFTISSELMKYKENPPSNEDQDENSSKGKYDASSWILKKKYDELVALREQQMATSAPKTGGQEAEKAYQEWLEKFRFELQGNGAGSLDDLQFDEQQKALIEKMQEVAPNLDHLEKIEFQTISDAEGKPSFPQDKRQALLTALQQLETGKIPESLSGQQKLVFAQNIQYVKDKILSGNFELDESGVPIFLNEEKQVVFEDLSHLLAKGAFIIDENSGINHKGTLQFGAVALHKPELLHAAAPKEMEGIDLDNFRLTDREKKSLIIKKQFRLSKEAQSEFEIWQESAQKLLVILIFLTFFEFLAGILIILYLLKRLNRIKKFLKIYASDNTKK